MPDGILFLQACLASAAASGLLVLGGRRLVRSPSPSTSPLWGLLPVAAGLTVGYAVLRFSWQWPPGNALQRLLQLLIPAALLIECLAAWRGVSRGVAWGLRACLAVAAGPVLLFGSVYFDARHAPWSTAEAAATLLAGSLLLGAEWWLLVRLARREAGLSLVIALALALLSGGLATMLAGYLKGGTAALPWAAALIGAGAAARWSVPRASWDGAIGLSTFALFGLLFIGRFFGNLTTPAALAILLAPVLAWASELPRLRHWPAWARIAVRLGLVAIPLLIVLTLAKRAFDREYAPLLWQGEMRAVATRDESQRSPMRGDL